MLILKNSKFQREVKITVCTSVSKARSLLVSVNKLANQKTEWSPTIDLKVLSNFENFDAIYSRLLIIIEERWF